MIEEYLVYDLNFSDKIAIHKTRFLDDALNYVQHHLTNALVKGCLTNKIYYGKGN